MLMQILNLCSCFALDDVTCYVFFMNSLECSCRANQSDSLKTKHENVFEHADAPHLIGLTISTQV